MDGSSGWVEMVSHIIIRCLVALEWALGRVRTPPTAVAALRSRIVDTRLVVLVGVVDDRGGRGGGGGGRGGVGLRHLIVC